MTPALGKFVERARSEVDSALERLLPREEEGGVPPVLARAMRHSVFAGGKRLRPVLALACCELAGGERSRALAYACAVEMVHTYSLIHDDLPAMDDDELRRGKPTCHVAFGEANAVLAGDALLTLAFETVAREYEDGLCRRLVAVLARGAGAEGMVGGQVLDVGAEGSEARPELVSAMHEKKTAALIRAATVGGAACGGAGRDVERALSDYGLKAGLAFQIADDILDETSTPEELGKAVRKDAGKGKMTYVIAVGLERARARARELVEEAKDSLAAFGESARVLAELADYIVERSW